MQPEHCTKLVVGARRVAMLEEELGRMNLDLTAIAAFQAKEAEYAQRVSDLEAATAERDNVSCGPCCTLCPGVLLKGGSPFFAIFQT